MQARPVPSNTPLRAMGRQVIASAEVVDGLRHLMHPQPPGRCLTRTMASKAQNTAPSAAKVAPPTTGYAPLHTTAPVTHSATPAASKNSRHGR